MSEVRLSIVVPCYNEEKNLPLVADGFRRAVGARRDVEVIFVENGSTDDSARVLDGLVATMPFARVVRVRPNRGYGHGVLAGLGQARGAWLGWTHADVQTDPADAIRAGDVAFAQPGPVLVKGARRGRPLGARLFTAAMGLFASAIFRTWLTEINAQPKIFPREFYAEWVDPPRDFSLDLYAYVLAKRGGLRVERIPVLFPDRVHGHSAWNTSFGARVRAIARTVRFSLELRRKLACTSSPTA